MKHVNLEVVKNAGTCLGTSSLESREESRHMVD